MVDTARSPNPALSGLRSRVAARLDQKGDTAAHPADEDWIEGAEIDHGADVDLRSGMLELSDLTTFVPIEPINDDWDADDDDPTVVVSSASLDGLATLIPAPVGTADPAGQPASTPAPPLLTARRLALVALAGVAAAIIAVGTLAITRSGPFASLRAEHAARALARHLHDISAPTALGSKSLASAATKSWSTAFASPAPAPQLRLPVPLPVPADPYEPANYSDIGRIDIPKIGLSTPLHQGVTLSAIDKGPSYWPGTARPGTLGNLVIAGHRVSHTAPFYRINELEAGDTMTVTLASGTAYTYRVTGSDIVDPEELSIVGQRPAYEATLFACHPRGSARRRYVVHFELLGPDLQPTQLGEYRLVNE